jgi:hypothetical protein
MWKLIIIIGEESDLGIAVYGSHEPGNQERKFKEFVGAKGHIR